MNENLRTERESPELSADPLFRWSRGFGRHNVSPQVSGVRPGAPLECHLLYHSDSEHLQQLYTGLLLLRESGFIRLSQQYRQFPVDYANNAPHLKSAGHAHLDVLLDGRLKLHFDTHDAQEIATSELERCDFYFKRSYAADVVAALPPDRRKRVFPLGLNYRVLPDELDFFAVRRGVRLNGISRASLSAIKRACDIGDFLGPLPRLAHMQSSTNPEAEPQVLFLVAAYDPYDDPQREARKTRDRIQINENRARIIRLMREALGSRFTGGFADSRFSRQHYADLIVPREMTHQPSYLERLRKTPICIATTGLHGSIGWKLAEYVAFAKAPVSEPLNYQVPGAFEREKNFLEFTSPEECLTATVRLIEDRGLRQELMRNNAAYYLSHLRPDSLVRNALLTALEHEPRRV